MVPTLPGTNANRLNGRREEVPSSSTMSLRWESEAIILRGDDRDELRRRVLELGDFLTHTPAVELKDLAFTLNTSLAPGGSRLAMVVESVADLQTRLARADERLADPRCRQIKDSRGSYFFETPLHSQGKLALFFPGEGSQYLNMLGDLLPHFPEVRQHFERCDRLSMRAVGATSRSVAISSGPKPSRRPRRMRLRRTCGGWAMRSPASSSPNGRCICCCTNWGCGRMRSAGTAPASSPRF